MYEGQDLRKYMQTVLKLGEVGQEVIIYSYFIWTINISLDHLFDCLNSFHIKISSINFFPWIMPKMCNYCTLFYINIYCIYNKLNPRKLKTRNEELIVAFWDIFKCMKVKVASDFACICCHHVSATVYCCDHFYFERKKQK